MLSLSGRFLALLMAVISALAIAFGWSGATVPHGRKVFAAVAQPSGYLYYRVRRGDTLSQIAERLGANMDAIAWLSGLKDPNLLQIGQVLTVPLENDAVAPAAPFASSTRPTAVAVALTAAARAAETADGNLRITSAGNTLALLAPDFYWPVRGRISSPFGPRWGHLHEGIDIAVPIGTPVQAAAPGLVVRAGWESGYGRTVVIDHSFGLETLYAHASKVLVTKGEVVAAGQAIALVGESGDATGPHLHFEIRFRGLPRNPLPLLEPITVGENDR